MICFSFGVICLPCGAISLTDDILTELQGISLNDVTALSQQGYSSYKIAEMTGKNRRTISKFLRRRRVRGSEENLPRSGKGRKTGVRGDRIMYRMLRSDRRQSLGEITDQFNRQFVTKISSRTVRRTLVQPITFRS
jgi:transposase